MNLRSRSFERVRALAYDWERPLWASSVFLLCLVVFESLTRYNLWRFEHGAQYWDLFSRVDDWFPFHPEFVWIYVLYYPLVLAPLVVLKTREELRHAVLAYLVLYAIGWVCYVLIPVRMVLPTYVADGWSTQLLASIHRADAGFNVFPSLHVANAFLVAFFFRRAGSRLYWPSLLVAGLITLSTLYIKQHYFLDLPAGFLLSYAVFQLAYVQLEEHAAAPNPSSYEPR